MVSFSLLFFLCLYIGIQSGFGDSNQLKEKAKEWEWDQKIYVFKWITPTEIVQSKGVIFSVSDFDLEPGSLQ